jgi:hypothetical protein
MLAGKTSERILLILEDGEQGKSCFLRWLLRECEQQEPPVPAVLLDFDRRKSGLSDYMAVARAIRRYLGDAHTPAICACEHNLHHHGPLVNIQTGTGDAGVDFGRRGRFAEADIADVAGRDRIEIGAVHGTAPTEELTAWQKTEMGRALYRDLAGLEQSGQQVVLLIDTFEHIPDEVCTWLERWVLERMRREFSHVLAIIAGRPTECRPFFAQPRLWGHLVAPMRFEALNDEDILAHYRLRKLPVDETEVSLLLDLARSSPARMAQVGDWIEQTRGGGR